MLLLSALLGKQGPRYLVALQSHRAALEKRRNQLAADNAAFRTRIAKLRSDDRYIERLDTRRELGYARPDELVYKFADEDAHEEERRRAEASRENQKTAREISRYSRAWLSAPRRSPSAY